MLARLDRIEGVRESRVDWTGRHVLLVLAPDGDEPAVVASAAGVLGEEARRLDAAREAQRVEAFRAGETWLRAAETVQLSAEEARVVGARVARQAAEAVGLDTASAERLVAIVQEELRRAFEELHAAGPDAPFDIGSPDAPWLARVRERCRAFLDDARIERLFEAIAS